jgi:hypothetical protein
LLFFQELIPAIHSKSSAKSLFFQAQKGASRVALFEQEKLRFLPPGFPPKLRGYLG